jgi:DNA-binding LytR/AlgR family response regulator
MQNKSMLSRGKLKEVVQDLDHQLGIQISRSVWVSFAEISQTKEDDKGYLEVILKDGSAFKVTSSRRLAFLQNFDRYK